MMIASIVQLSKGLSGIIDYIDEDGIGHFKNRRWYSNLKYKGKNIQVSLDANKGEILNG